ncbi:mucolipin [Anaeramoeba flamelloides]|uniref:Mucolipin n=1 Tax=Anaeramoeba flamelloides TaxID=1746091 RepID=A0AAV7ZG86_9EUKA|nr:mucolipin [Anaeramoeba flamelloides]KAJ6235817.1 mucolipin [Anaeramoeba flamelloides]
MLCDFCNLEGDGWCGIQMKRVPPEKYLTLSPIKLLTRYHRPPIKFMLLLTIVISITVQIIAFSSIKTYYGSSNNLLMSSVFLPGSKDLLDSMNGKIENTFYTIQDFLGSIKAVSTNFYEFPENSIGYYDFVYDDHNNITKPQITIEFYEHLYLNKFDYKKIVSKKFRTETHELTLENPLGPFTKHKSDIRDYLANFRKATIVLKLKNILRGKLPRCFIWTIQITYDFSSSGGTIVTHITTKSKEINQKKMIKYQLKSQHTITIFLIFILSIWLFTLSIKSLIFEYNLSKKTYKKLLERKSLSFHSDQFSSSGAFKQAFYHFWNIWQIPTCILLILSQVIYFVREMGSNAIPEYLVSFFLGLSAFFAWCSLIGYFQWYPKYYSLINVLSRSLPKVLRYIFGSLPLFFGYAFLGTIFFGSYSEYFATIDQTCVTLFAVLNGDVVRDTFTMIYNKSSGMAVFSRIYLYTFVCLFIYAWVNVFVSIAEEAFISILKDPKPINLTGKANLKKFISKTGQLSKRDDGIPKSKGTRSAIFISKDKSSFWGTNDNSRLLNLSGRIGSLNNNLNQSSSDSQDTSSVSSDADIETTPLLNVKTIKKK